MIRILRQSTSVDLPIGPFLDSTDGSTAETGLTITQPDIRLKKNGGNWAQKNAAQTLTHEENGNYEVTLDEKDKGRGATARILINGTEVGSGTVPVSAPLLFSANDCLDIGRAYGGPVSRQYADRMPFAFDGRIDRVHIAYA